ncbi:hypothetical protein NADFUDRAFT_49060 [Nadsonia fulvescens var. elongata DSM 6958]|uniref:ditrans,polycis-polyprenyl diphosphate synthase [(2E,6E)-farnesyldiphosphate specific] n=1 Tax=Nadsonia fulvescens var. elongata DSM 6958 TaxID=857566 RepID=A0A1E3PSN0_9ASCO|nr:hypothetical protein NADFUDRAFT_49060 [Nadsonia fulvescens var. elongata DSM 6958]
MARTYYSPKTYGYSGFKVKGFEIDDIFSAATNPEMMPDSTFDLLKFHIRHIILNHIYNIISFWQRAVYKFNQLVWNFWLILAWIYEVFLGNLAISIFSNPTKHLNPKTILSENPSSVTALKHCMAKLEYIPSHIGVIFKMYDLPSPETSLPEPYQLADGSMIIPTEEEIRSVREQIEESDQKRRDHASEELNRHYEDICNLVVWCILINVRKITIYEKSGKLGQNHTAIMKAIQKKLDSIYYNKSTFGHGADSSLTTIRLNPYFEEVGIRLTTPASKKSLTFPLRLASQTCNPARAEFDYKDKKSHLLCINGLNSDFSFAGGFAGLEIVFLDQTDGRGRIISLTKELSKQAIDRNCDKDLWKTQHSIDDSFILETFQNQIHGFPDLLITYGFSKSLDGYPPLGVMNSAIFYSKIGKGANFNFKIFLKALQFYSKLARNGRIRGKDTS